jgi:4-amino-4-deoxy-L-arabinose transferase-like glycosyltransferase
VPLAAIVLLAAAIRFATLDLQSFDDFESYTVALMAMSFGGMLDALPSFEGTPPLYYVLAWAWSGVLGDGEFALRSLSALFGVATVAVAHAAASVMGSRRMALIAALLVALSPIAVWYSQEARAYALVTLLVGLALLFFLRELAGRGRRSMNLAAWSLAAGLALATHYFAVLFVAPMAAWLLLRSAGRRAVLLALLLPVAVGLALIPLADDQTAHAGGDETSQTSLGRRVPQVAKQLLVGYNLPAELLITLAAALGCAVAALLAWTRARRDDRWTAGVGAAVAASAVLLLFALALIGPDYFLSRYLVPIVVPLFAALAAGFAVARGGWAALAVTLLAFAAALVAVAIDPLAQRPDFRGALEGLGEPPPGGRALLVSSFGVRIEAFRPGARPMPTPEPPVREVVVVGLPVVGGEVREEFPPAVELVPDGFSAVSETSTDGFTRVVLRSERPRPVSKLALFDAEAPHELFLEP